MITSALRNTFIGVSYYNAHPDFFMHAGCWGHPNSDCANVQDIRGGGGYVGATSRCAGCPGHDP